MVEDSINDATCILDGYTFARTIPACVHQVSLCTALLHSLYQFLCILCWVQLEESLTEASRESRSRLGDSALCSGKFCCEAWEEVVLRLFRIEDRNRRKHAESVCAKEDNLLCSRACALAVHLLHDVCYVLYRVRNASILCYALVCEVYLAVFCNCNVLKQCVTLDGVVDVRFALFVEVDNLCIATTFEVEHALIVPSVLIVTDKKTLRVGRKCGLSCSWQTEEDSGVLTILVGICRTVHWCDALQWQVVVLHWEHTFLHLATIPCVYDYLFAVCGVESNAGFRVQSEFLVVFHLCLWGVVNNEIRLEILQFFCCRTDEHVCYEVCLPCHFHNEAHWKTCRLVSATECINHVEILVTKFLDSDVLYLAPYFFAHGVVVILVFFRCPPYLVVALCIVNDVLVLRRAAGIDSSHNVYSV